MVPYIPVNRSDLTRWTLDFPPPCRTPPGRLAMLYREASRERLGNIKARRQHKGRYRSRAKAGRLHSAEDLRLAAELEAFRTRRRGQGREHSDQHEQQRPHRGTTLHRCEASTGQE
jgi:hypothetical protein